MAHASPLEKLGLTLTIRDVLFLTGSYLLMIAQNATTYRGPDSSSADGQLHTDRISTDVDENESYERNVIPY